MKFDRISNFSILNYDNELKISLIELLNSSY